MVKRLAQETHTHRHTHLITFLHAPSFTFPITHIQHITLFPHTIYYTNIDCMK